MRRLIWPVLFLLLVVLQGVGSVFFTGWLTGDLPLVLLYSFALLRGKERGFAAGFGVGLIQDAMTVGVFGFHMLARGMAGYLAGAVKGKIIKDQPFLHMVLIGCISAFTRFCYWWVELLHTNGRWDIFPDFIWKSLGYCLGNMLLVLPILWVATYIYEWIKEDDISY